MRVNRYFSVVALATIALISPLSAQTLSDFRQKLEFERPTDPANAAEVTIREDDSARLALTELSSREVDNSIEGYRVGVFFDNSATARAKAMEVVDKCEKLFADIPTTMSYDNPYFKVSAGYCIDSEEAIMMLNRIQKHFPKAYLLREQITPEDLKKAHDMEVKFRNRAVPYVEVEDLD